MLEPSTLSRALDAEEFCFVRNYTKSVGLAAKLEIDHLVLHAGREKMVIKTSGEKGKRKVSSGRYIDKLDGNEVFTDLLTNPQRNEIEVWFWKPFPGTHLLSVPDWRCFEIDDV